ncbi:hypothetical protein BH11MYX2_BH11MYX2_10140 [soil metagenome]
MKKTAIAITMAALALGGCKKKDGDESGRAGEAPKGADGGGPAAFAPWQQKDAAKLWEGAWKGRMTLESSKKGYSSMAGDQAAYEVKGDKATVTDGTNDATMKFTLEAPCQAQFTEDITAGGMKGGKAFHEKTFVLENGALGIGEAAAGYRKGKAAIVCSSDGVTIVDDKGGCATWKKTFDKWESKDEKCEWSQDAGKDKLTIGTGDWSRKVYAAGDVLAAEQFRDEAKYTEKSADLATAKKSVGDAVKKDDPAEQAKAAGGVAGKTDSIASLTVSFAADESLKGKPIELTGLLKQTGTMSSNGETMQQFLLKDVDSKDDKIDMFCMGKTPAPEGVKTGDKVTATGTLDKSFGKPELKDCTITAVK